MVKLFKDFAFHIVEIGQLFLIFFFQLSQVVFQIGSGHVLLRKDILQLDNLVHIKVFGFLLPLLEVVNFLEKLADLWGVVGERVLGRRLLFGRGKELL
jgi:hypothetical protein